MPPRKKDVPTGSDDDALVDVLHNLTQELRVVRDVLDEIREQVTWGLRNDGFRRDVCPVLKQMGRDPTADDWGEKLIIAGNDPEPEPSGTDQSQELESAREVIRQLLKATELNLDDLEDGTRQAIERAREVAVQPAAAEAAPLSECPPKSAERPESAEAAQPTRPVVQASSPKGPKGRLF